MAGATGRDFTRREVLGRATRAGAGAYLFGALPALERAFPALGEERPNILFVFADDEMAEAETFAGNVPQALLLLNGELSNAGVRARAGGTVTAARAAARDGGEAAAIEALYLSAYGRAPEGAELEAALSFIRGYEEGADDERAYEDLLYALLLSSEFVTNH